jgi:hypothetical protein
MNGGLERKPGGSSIAQETFENGPAAMPGPGKRTLTEQLDRKVAPVGSQVAPTVQGQQAVGKGARKRYPSWAKGSKMEPGETPNQAADRVMRQRFPDGKYDKGPGSECNKIKKFFERSR